MGIQISPLHVRRSSFLRATPARVWEEFTSFERLAAWFGQGRVLEAYEPRTPLYDGCPVELFHHGFERLGAIAGCELEGHEAGWHTRHLESLRAIVEG